MSELRLRRASAHLGDVELAEAKLRGGATAAEAFAAAGANPRVVRLFTGLVDVDVPALASEVASALVRADRVRAPLRSVALYPLLLALGSLVFCLYSHFAVLPGLAQMRAAETGLGVSVDVAVTGTVLASALCAALLAWMWLALTRAAPRFPFHRAGVDHERALLLAAAAAACRAGAEPLKSIEAGAALVEHAAMARDALGYASALARGGEPEGGRLAFGAHGRAALSSAAAGGAAAELLDALASHASASVDATAEGVARAAELQAVVIGGVAVLAAALAFLLPYKATFLGMTS